MRIIFIFYQPLVIVCRNQESRVKDFYTFMVIKIPAQYIKPSYSRTETASNR